MGGGGLISGIAAYVKRLRPEIRIIGVEPVDADAMARSLAAGRRVKLAQVGLFADGVAVKQVGEETFRICRELVDEMVLVDTDAICAAIKDVFQDTRAILEPAGRARHRRRQGLGRAHAGARARTLVAIACGANMNFDRLRFVAEQAELGEQREAVLAVTIPERPGSFREFCALIGARNVTEFNYRYADAEGRARLRRPAGGRPPRDRGAGALAAGAPGCPRSTSATTRSPSCTCATWWAGMRRPRWTTRSSTASSSRSGPARS